MPMARSTSNTSPSHTPATPATTKIGMLAFTGILPRRTCALRHAGPARGDRMHESVLDPR